MYALPLAEFTQARNEEARRLRKTGSAEDAERVKALRKPTAAAAAANRLAREHRRELEQFLRSAVALRDAQLAGKGDLAVATRQEREALARLVRAGGEAVRQTLLAAAVDEDAAAQLLAARLEHELEPRGFGTLLGHARPDAPPPRRPAAPEKPKPAAPRKQKPDDRAARAKLQEATRARSAAESEERRAGRRFAEAQKELERAKAAVDKARHDLDRVHGRPPRRS